MKLKLDEVSSDNFSILTSVYGYSMVLICMVQEDRDYDFPDELDNIIGKRMLLSLKLNDFNKRYPNASISVISYTLAHNLMEKFNSTQDEVNKNLASFMFIFTGTYDLLQVVFKYCVNLVGFSVSCCGFGGGGNLYILGENFFSQLSLFS